MHSDRRERCGAFSMPSNHASFSILEEKLHWPLCGSDWVFEVQSALRAYPFEMLAVLLGTGAAYAAIYPVGVGYTKKGPTGKSYPCPSSAQGLFSPDRPLR